MSTWFQELVNKEKDGWLNEGMQQGRQEERKYIFDNLIKNGIITEEEANKQLKLI